MNKLFKTFTREIKKRDLWLLTNVMEQYNTSDYLKHVAYDPDTYNKKTLFANNMVEIVLICWKEGQKSPIHDHPENGCIMKLLSGQLKEVRYTTNLKNNAVTYIKPNDVLYIDNYIGFHDIEALKDSVSLHVYSPPHHVAKTYSGLVTDA